MLITLWIYGCVYLTQNISEEKKEFRYFGRHSYLVILVKIFNKINITTL